MKNQGMEGLLYGEKVAKNGLIGLVILAILKAAAGFLTGTVVLLADAIATGADALALFGSFMGLKLSKRGAEGGFKYGYYKIETLIAFLISCSIIYLGAGVLIESIQLFQKQPTAEYPLFGIAMVMLSIAFSLYYARQLRQAAEKSNSLSLLNNAKDKESDILTSFAVLAAIVASFYKLPYVEAIVGIIISALILKVGIESAKDSIFYLLDYWDDPVLLKKIENIIQKNAKLVKEIKKIRLRRAGTWIFGEVYVEIPSFADSKDIRGELNRLQQKIHEANEHIKDFIIYFKISKPVSIQVAIPIMEKGEEKSSITMAAKIAMTTEETTHYLIMDIEEKKIKNIHSIPIDLKNIANMNKVVEALKKEKVDVVINNNLHSLLYYNLQHIHHMQLYPMFPNIQTVEETVKLLLIDM